jgi:predicted RNA methylase
MSGLKRNNNEKYYTNPELCEKYIKLFNQVVKPKSTSTIIEPSAGNGSFSLILNKIFPHVLSYDIKPENDIVTKQDYLVLEIEDDIKKSDIHVIGNPPFGRQSTLAKKFIKKSCEFATSISFILPKSFKKDSFQKTFPVYYHLIYSEEVPKNSFFLDKISYDVPCVFQIWIKKNYPRIVPKVQVPKYYKFVNKTDNPDFSIRRVGGTAGSLDTDICGKSEQSHYFIKLNIDLPDFEETYNMHIKFEHNNTVGPKSISKQELIEKLNILYIFV